MYAYSEHSPKAATSFPATVTFNLNMISSLLSDISTNAATALATTVGLVSARRSLYPQHNRLGQTCMCYIFNRITHRSKATNPSLSITFLPVSVTYSFATLSSPTPFITLTSAHPYSTSQYVLVTLTQSPPSSSHMDRCPAVLPVADR